MGAQLAFVLSQITRLTVGQTERRTDGQTDRQTGSFLVARPCCMQSMQRGKTYNTVHFIL